VKVAYVVPRYGPEVTGGAESGARAFAERLVAWRGWEVEIFTTCATDALTWEDVLEPGMSSVDGVTVRRFASAAGRDVGFHPYWGSLRPRALDGTATLEEAERFVDLQGPRTPALVDAVAASDADVVVFYPYLYYPTVRGLPPVAARSVLHPAAHDEPALALPVFDGLFAAAGALVFQTAAERELVMDRFGVTTTPQILLGLGVDGPPPRAGHSVVDERLRGRPFVLCLGRVDDEKGAGMLTRYFAAYKDRHPGPLTLVFAGPVIDRPPERDDIEVLGVVPEADKWALLETAAVLVSPSPWEAFSLVVVEAMAAATPVLVNARCGPTHENAERSGGGLWFDGYAEFEVALHRLVSDPRVRTAMGELGRTFVDRHFRWPALIDRYAAFLERAAARGRAAAGQPDASPNRSA
jgi:glycosyltransferase involved in cell wall biosynthesis